MVYADDNNIISLQLYHETNLETIRHTFRNLRSRIKQINIGNRIINSRVFIYYYIFRFSFHFISLEYLVDFHFFYIWVGLGGIFRLFYLPFSSSTWIVINNVFFYVLLYYITIIIFLQKRIIPQPRHSRTLQKLVFISDLYLRT